MVEDFSAETVADYQTSVTGAVATIARDALSEPGSRIIQIFYNSTPPPKPSTSLKLI